MPWPTDPRTCIAEQEQLARAAPEPWRPAGPPELVAGCFVCFPRGPMGSGAAGDPAWAAAALTTRGRAVTVSVVTGVASAPYEAGLLALREGAVLEAVVRRLPRVPDVLLVDATGRDHPRRAGLALHLGATLGMPTVGVTHRPLLADGPWPPAARGTHEPLMLDGARVGAWLRVASRARPRCTPRGAPTSTPRSPSSWPARAVSGHPNRSAARARLPAALALPPSRAPAARSVALSDARPACVTAR